MKQDQPAGLSGHGGQAAPGQPGGPSGSEAESTRLRPVGRGLRLLGVPVTGADWRELAYAVVMPLPGVLGALLMYPMLVLGLLLAITHLGIPLLAGALTLARRIGDVHRWLLRVLLRESIEAPVKSLPSGPSALRAAAMGGIGWRAATFALLAAPLSVLALLLTVGLRLYGLAAVLYPLWWRVARADGHRGLSIGTLALDTWPRILLVTLVGLLVTALSAWSAGLMRSLVRFTARGLLGARRRSAFLQERVRDLEETRALAVQDSAMTLRRIERDLHDGAQAQLIALVMALSSARSKLAPSGPDNAVAPPDLERGRELVEQALGNAHIAITELRDLVRGIHPPVLDTGLDAALESLACRTGVPVRLRVDVPARLPESVETIAYFCASELLSNAARHSGAALVELEATHRGDALILRVQDDGRGGAVMVPGAAGAGGSGLAGLAERVRTVDGRLLIRSPEGGPTTVTVELPT